MEGTMLPISQGKRKRLNAKLTSVRKWLEASDARLQANFEQMKKESPKHWGEQMRTIGVVITVLAGFFLFGCLMRHQPFSMLWWWIGGGALAFSFASVFVGGIVSKDYVEDRQAWLGRELAGMKQARETTDPFFRAAKLILDAHAAYETYCDRYMVWYTAVDEELQEPDEETANRNIALLDRAHDVIAQAAERFEHATELSAKREEFERSHPNATGKDSEALSILLARLDRPIEIPEIPSLPDPKLTLAVEEELAELAEELHGAALPAKTRS